jgi:hypothetical protein
MKFSRIKIILFFQYPLLIDWVSGWLLFNANSAIFSAMLWREQVNYQWDDDGVRFVLDQHAELELYSASSLRQQSAGRNVTPFGHIILIPSQPIFALSPLCCVLSGEATNTNVIVLGLTRLGLEPTIYLTRGEDVNHYATDAVLLIDVTTWIYFVTAW